MLKFIPKVICIYFIKQKMEKLQILFTVEKNWNGKELTES